MAVKKTATKASGAKAATKKAAPKKAAAKKAAPKKAATTAAKTTTKKAAPKKKAAVKLTDGQLALLKKVADAKEGYAGAKAEMRVLEALQTKKLIKKGAKDKATGAVKYTVSKVGEKHLATPAPAAPAPAPTA
jgi:hypothetical protein